MMVVQVTSYRHHFVLHIRGLSNTPCINLRMPYRRKFLREPNFNYLMWETTQLWVKLQSLSCTNYQHKVPIISTCTLLIDQLLAVWANLWVISVYFIGSLWKFCRIDSLWITSFHRIFTNMRPAVWEIFRLDLLFSNTKLKSTVSNLRLYSASVTITKEKNNCKDRIFYAT